MNFSTTIPWRANYYLARRRAQVEAEYLEKRVSPGRPLRLDDPELGRTAARKNFFILGSGASANDVTHHHRELITAGFSVGLNSWAFHEFIPDAYALENPRRAGFEPQIGAINAGLRRPAVLEQKPAVFWFRDGASALPSGRIDIPGELDEATYRYGRFQFGPARLNQIDALIKRFFGASFKGQLPQHALLDNGSSVIRMITLAALLKFESVVLVGVDLGRRPYFFEEDARHLDAIGQSAFRLTSMDGSHPTEEAAARTLPFLDFAAALANVIAAFGRTKVYSGNDLLSGVIPPFYW
jgi:hypothetical protein